MKIICSCGYQLVVTKGRAKCKMCKRSYSIKESGGPISRKKKDVMTGDMKSLLIRFVGVMTIFLMLMMLALLNAPR